MQATELRTTGTTDRPKDDALQVMKAGAIKAFRLLRGTLHAGTTDLQGVVDIFIYFDAAHTLTECHPFDRPSSHTYYNVLCSVLTDFFTEPVFVVFLSTTSRIGASASPRCPEEAAHALASDVPQALITETPFDCAPNILVRQDTHTRQEVADPRFMARFGRPL